MKSERYDGERGPVRPSVHPAAIAITALVASVSRWPTSADMVAAGLERLVEDACLGREDVCRSPPVANVVLMVRAAPGRAFRPFYGRAEPANTALKGLDHVENVGDDLAVENRRGRRASAPRRSGPR